VKRYVKALSAASTPPGSAAGLSVPLRERCPEIEAMVVARLDSVVDPSEVADPSYPAGLRAAVSAAVDVGIEALEGGAKAVTIPSALLAQARRAARVGVSLDTVLRRYVAGHLLLTDFIIQEADRNPLPATEIQRALREESSLLDRVLVAVTNEYRREADDRLRTSGQRRAALVRELLEGGLADGSQLNYDFDDWHVGLVMVGPHAAELIRELASGVDQRLLLVQPERDVVWAWFGSRHRIDPEGVLAVIGSRQQRESSVALGEPAAGASGWRLTHRQASSALSVAQRSASRVARYADVGVLATVIEDETLVQSLADLYLAPLALGRDGGESSRQTLRAYFSANCNVSSAAAALGVSRKTVGSRLNVIEERLGRPLAACAIDLITALRLEELGRISVSVPDE
jgi:hypothetical protein